MVIYDLVCSFGHEFEGWFKSPSDYDQQWSSELLECPFCADTQIVKKPVAAKIARHSHKEGNEAGGVGGHDGSLKVTGEHKKELNRSDIGTKVSAGPGSPAEILRFVHNFVEKNFENVGEDFSRETRKMHYGESDKRNIRGQATAEEITELQEEGIDTFVLPAKLPGKNDLN
ncbi:MAG: DUF1178 family protein [Arenicella sp.]